MTDETNIVEDIEIPAGEPDANEFAELAEAEEQGELDNGETEVEVPDPTPEDPETPSDLGGPDGEPELAPAAVTPPPTDAATPGTDPDPVPAPTPDPAPVAFTPDQLAAAMQQMGLDPRQLAAMQQQQNQQFQQQQSNQVARQRDNAIQQLKELYAIDAETAQSILASPEEVLPGILGQLHLNVVEQAISQVSAYLPQAITQHTSVSTTNQQLEQEFYQMFPALNDEKYGDTVLNMARSLSQSGQQMQPEDFMKQLGVAASIALGVDLPNQPAPAQSTPERVIPFQPPGQQKGAGNPVGTQPTPQGKDNEFAVLSETYYDL